MTMASSSKDYRDVMWEAAKDPDIPDVKDDMCWPLLNMFLKKSGLDMTMRKEDESMKQLHRLRKALRKGESNIPERSSSAESERRSDRPFFDSAYNSESPHDQVCSPLFLMSSMPELINV